MKTLELSMSRAAVLRAALMATLGLVACGGGGGGGSSGGEVAVGRFTKVVALPATPGDWTELFHSSGADGARFQALVRARDIRGSGPLESLTLRFGEPSTGNTCPNVTIELLHRDAEAGDLGTTFADNGATGRGTPVNVFGPATLTIPAGAIGDEFTVPLRGGFNYNGVDDLVVDVESDACTADTVLAAHAASPAYTAVIYSHDRGAATGSDWSSLADLKLTFAGGGNQVQSSSGTSTTLSVPFHDDGSSYPTGTRTQVLYYPSEVNGRGPITGLALEVNDTTTAQVHTVTVKLGHSTRSTLTDTFADNFDGGAPATVADAVTVEIPAGLPAGHYLWVPLPDGVFSYNGTDNLVVEIEATTSSAYTNVRAHDDGTGRRLLAALGSETGNVYTAVFDLELRFAGGTLDALTPAAMSSGNVDAFPFYGAVDAKRQFLYRAAELGTPGTITKIACRARLGGGAESGFDYTVQLGHSAASTLDAAFATNLPDPVTVFSGTFDLPAVAAGDWIEIPLTTPFAYNGRDNLILQISGSGGTADGFGCASDNTAESAALYAARRLYGSTSDAATGFVGNTMIDTRFTLQ